MFLPSQSSVVPINLSSAVKSLASISSEDFDVNSQCVGPTRGPGNSRELHCESVCAWLWRLPAQAEVWGGKQQGVISVYQEEKKGKKETAGRTKDKSGSRALDEAWERGQDMEGQVQKESMENRCSENPNWS